MTTENTSSDTNITHNKDPFLVRVFKIFRNLVISDKKIGELNGKWAAMFKLGIIGIVFFIPTFFTWAVWVTNGIYYSNYHVETYYIDDLPDRLVSLEKRTLKCEQQSHNIEELETEFNQISNKLVILDKNNSTEHTQIVTTLKSVKELLQYIKDK